MLVNKRVKLWGFEEELEVKIEKLEDYTTYLVEVANDKNSYIHRAIMYTDEYKEEKETMPVRLFCNDYEDINHTSIDKIYYIKVIAELSMDIDTGVVYQQTNSTPAESATVEDFNDSQPDETPSVETSDSETPSVIIETEESTHSEAPSVIIEESAEEGDQGLPMLEL